MPVTERQKEILAGFSPCLVPPRDLRNPERAGQASDHSRAEQLLTRLRRMPPRKREEAIRRVAERIAAKLAEHTGGLSAEERRAEVERVSTFGQSVGVDVGSGKTLVSDRHSVDQGRFPARRGDLRVGGALAGEKANEDLGLFGQLAVAGHNMTGLCRFKSLPVRTWRSFMPRLKCPSRAA